jgi:hypothetical protein
VEYHGSPLPFSLVDISVKVVYDGHISIHGRDFLFEERKAHRIQSQRSLQTGSDIEYSGILHEPGRCRRWYDIRVACYSPS